MNTKIDDREVIDNVCDYRLVFFKDGVNICRVVFSLDGEIISMNPVMLGNFENAQKLVSELEKMVEAVRRKPILKMNCDSSKYSDSFYEQYKNIVNPDFFEPYIDWFQKQVSLCRDCFKDK